jgi:hypothetical protein
MALIRLRFGFLIMISGVVAMPVSAKASGNFDGDWYYNTTDVTGASFAGAELHLTENGGAVSGRWGEGTDQKAWSGNLIGQVHNGRLHVRFCFDDGWGNASARCPHFGPESAVFVIRDGKLIWYRTQGSHLQEYVTLMPG